MLVVSVNPISCRRGGCGGQVPSFLLSLVLSAGAAGCSAVRPEEEVAERAMLARPLQPAVLLLCRACGAGRGGGGKGEHDGLRAHDDVTSIGSGGVGVGRLAGSGCNGRTAERVEPSKYARPAADGVARQQSLQQRLFFRPLQKIYLAN